MTALFAEVFNNYFEDLDRSIELTSKLLRYSNLKKIQFSLKPFLY
jgi:hypothetical protein